MRALALGLLAATGIALAVPVSAEELRIGVPGVGVEIGTHRDRDRDRDYRRTDGYDRSYASERCQVTIIRREDGGVSKIRRCRD